MSLRINILTEKVKILYMFEFGVGTLVGFITIYNKPIFIFITRTKRT
jgi:hypothetical protein